MNVEGCLQLVGKGWASALAQLHSCTCAWTNTRKTGLRVTMREGLPEVCIHASLLITGSQCCSCCVCLNQQVTPDRIKQASAAAGS